MNEQVNEEKNAVADEVAVAEVIEFVAQHNRKKHDSESIVTMYPDVVDAVKFGNLTFSDNGPVFRLTEPVISEGGTADVNEVTFKTRIKPSEQRQLMNGIDMTKNQLLYGHKCMSFIVSQPLAMLDKFGNFDLKVIEQISTLFT